MAPAGFRILLLLFGLLWGLSPGLAQFMEPHIVQEPTEAYTASLVAEWGTDTASIETFTLMGDHLFGRAIHLYPEPHLRQFSFRFNEDGSMRSFRIHFYDLKNTSVPLISKTGMLPSLITMRSSEGVVDFRLVDAEGEKQFTHLVPRMDFLGDWIPLFGQWQWLTDRLLRDELEEDLLFLNYTIGDYKLRVYERSPGEVVFESDISAPITFFLDGQGKIEEVNAMGSPWNYRLYRTEQPLDVERFAKAFAQKPVVGDPSPDASIAKEILGMPVTLEYGRPYKRGREIFGNVVPYGHVWRTGAGPPTKLTIPRDLRFEDVTLPSGTYNLFTIPERDAWTLIFNTQEHAWGSAHRPAYDLVEVPMQRRDLDEVVDPFTIRLEERDGMGVLEMMWDRTMAWVTFSLDDRP